ncbi:MAG: hypothetical protein EZS28_027298 [Streblomastix strix]|uniref:Uncharacterized protein n=1 Tax=Streblomastix strix TaxID=222440 RepID=A0A5J4V3I6_9EUKA|nr:MAG: hypothetical protein EZS28_027298 [Streblomastix strix]
MTQIQQDVVTKSKSNSDEPRVCIDGLGCQSGWLPTNLPNELSSWAIVLIVFGALLFSGIVTFLVLFCCYKLLSKIIVTYKGKNAEQKVNFVSVDIDSSLVIFPSALPSSTA